MGGQCLHCDLCGGEFSSKPEWNSHLVASAHQTIAREKWKDFWSDEFSRETSSIVFSSFVINEQTGLELVNKFSSKIRDYVTQFVWWTERPFMGVIQFESRKKLDEITDSLESGTDTNVNGKLIQLRRSSEPLPLEWKTLLPPPHKESQLVEEPIKSAPCQLDSEQNSIIHPSSVILHPRSQLQTDWNSICALIEVTDAECETVAKIFAAVSQLYGKACSSCDVILFRNYFLRLQSPSEASNTVLLFAYILPRNSRHNIVGVNKSTEDKALERPEFANLLPGYQRTAFSPYHIESTRFQHESSGFMFNIVTIPFTIGEAYMVRLTLYMARFDKRLKGVLTLVTYWAKMHQIRIAEVIELNKDTHCVLPEPLPLQWMVILFLIKEGILPSVREILDRPHKPLMICNKRGPGHDIGFSTDEDFVKEWTKGKSVPAADTDEFITSVVQLTKEFFKFYSSNLKEGCWLLNSKDGELIKREGTRVRKSSLSSQEIEKLTIVEESEKSLYPQVKINYSRISFLHPLVITWRLSFCVDKWTESTCSKMEEMGLKLEEYLNQGMAGETLQSLLAGGQQQAEKFQLELECENNQRLRTAIKTKRAGGSTNFKGKRGKF